MVETSILEPECHFLGAVPYSLNAHYMKDRMEIGKQYSYVLQALSFSGSLSSSGLHLGQGLRAPTESSQSSKSAYSLAPQCQPPKMAFLSSRIIKTLNPAVTWES